MQASHDRGDRGRRVAANGRAVLIVHGIEVDATRLGNLPTGAVPGAAAPASAVPQSQSATPAAAEPKVDSGGGGVGRLLQGIFGGADSGRQ